MEHVFKHTDDAIQLLVPPKAGKQVGKVLLLSALEKISKITLYLIEMDWKDNGVEYALIKEAPSANFDYCMGQYCSPH